MMVANVNSGNLTAVARDWSYLPPHAHAKGIEALLQTALFAGIPKCMNALATVYQVYMYSVFFLHLINFSA